MLSYAALLLRECAALDLRLRAGARFLLPELERSGATLLPFVFTLWRNASMRSMLFVIRGLWLITMARVTSSPKSCSSVRSVCSVNFCRMFDSTACVSMAEHATTYGKFVNACKPL